MADYGVFNGIFLFYAKYGAGLEIRTCKAQCFWNENLKCVSKEFREFVSVKKIFKFFIKK